MSAPADNKRWLDLQSFGVAGMGSALPGPSIGTDELLRHVDRQFGLSLTGRGRAAARRLGIHARHICRDLQSREETARAGDGNAELAARAVESALQAAGRKVSDIRYLIAHTATPETLLPPGVATVSRLLGYGGPFAEFRQACTGFANALVMARSVLGAQDDGIVVIVGSETGSSYFDPVRAAESDEQLINMLQMGDGAAAIVLSRTAESRSRLHRIYHGQLGGSRAPGFKLTVGAQEFAHDYAGVRRHGVELFRAGLSAATAMGIATAEIDWIVPHQANGRMAELVGKALGLAPERVFVNASRVGNAGSAAIWLALAELRQCMRTGERALILGAEATQYMYGGFEYVHA